MAHCAIVILCVFRHLGLVLTGRVFPMLTHLGNYMRPPVRGLKDDVVMPGMGVESAGPFDEVSHRGPFFIFYFFCCIYNITSDRFLRLSTQHVSILFLPPHLR